VGTAGRPSLALLHAPLIACDEEIAARIPGCRLVRLPGVDHYLPLSAPGTVVAVVQELVKVSSQ